MRAALLDPVDDPRWERLVARSPMARIYHHPAWLALVGDSYRYRLAAPAVLDGDGEAIAGLPMALVTSRLTGRRLVALPFSDSCAPLLAEGASADGLHMLARGVEAERARRGLALEVRAAFPQLAAPAERFLAHAVDLREGIAGVERRYAPQVRRNVRKAERMGVTVHRAADVAALDVFYGLLLQTRRRLGVPTQPRAFIRGLAHVFAQGLGFVATARFEGRAVAAGVFLQTGRVITYKYGASDTRFQHVRPNNLMFAQVIRDACGTDVDTLDLGRTDVGQDGLAAFKRGMGATETPLAYTYRGTAPALGPPAAQRVAASLIRRSPVSVGRAVGELLYRHAG